MLKIRGIFLLSSLFLPHLAYASFIEASIGTAIVNDATATYFNPAALMLLKSPQVIGLGSVLHASTRFVGQAQQTSTGFTQKGSSSTRAMGYLPSFYLGFPVSHKITAGFALVSNFFNNDLENPSVLRYTQPENSIQDIDLVSAIGFEIVPFLSLGAGFNYSTANFIQKPISGFPSLNIPDSQSLNETYGRSVGGDLGLLLKPSTKTIIGFNFRSSNTYLFQGKSTLKAHHGFGSNNFHFKFWTPARAVLTVGHRATKQFGTAITINRIYWSIINKVDIYNAATLVGPSPRILPHVSIPYHLKDTWLLTLASQYHLNDKTVIRGAISYNESAENGKFQISTGDSLIVGGSLGFEIDKNINIDVGYAHSLIKQANIHIQSLNIITGVNNASRDAVSLKVIFKV